ncbi:hypothetical protein L3i20_v217840 [Paenibacillus sp. L3-i20]|nr:hypothetical protein L3i20_v217840 [Paenibacillus sp. L3-i20]
MVQETKVALLEGDKIVLRCVVESDCIACSEIYDRSWLYRQKLFEIYGDGAVFCEANGALRRP